VSYAFPRRFHLQPTKGAGAIVARRGSGGLVSPDSKALQVGATIAMYAGMGYGVYLVFTGSFLTGALVFCGAPVLTLLAVAALTDMSPI
jgi:hypothetical protein